MVYEKKKLSIICLYFFRVYDNCLLEYSHQVCHLAFGTPNTKNRASWAVLNVLKLWDMLQYTLMYTLIFESIRMKMPFPFIIFLFIFLSPLSSLYSFFFFFFLLSHSSSDIPINPSLLSLFFLIFVLLFSLLFSLATPPDVDLCCCGFFFFSDLMGRFSNGWLFFLLFSFVVPPDANLWCRSLCFLLLFLFFCGGGFGVLLWWF